jgi:hypothetical protein
MTWLLRARAALEYAVINRAVKIIKRLIFFIYLPVY